jgi:hypothetical protein
VRFGVALDARALRAPAHDPMTPQERSRCLATSGTGLPTVHAGRKSLTTTFGSRLKRARRQIHVDFHLSGWNSG